MATRCEQVMYVDRLDGPVRINGQPNGWTGLDGLDGLDGRWTDRTGVWVVGRIRRMDGWTDGSGRVRTDGRTDGHGRARTDLRYRYTQPMNPATNSHQNLPKTSINPTDQQKPKNHPLPFNTITPPMPNEPLTFPSGLNLQQSPTPRIN